MAIDLAQLEATCRRIGKRIGEGVPAGVGFVLLLFDFGDDGFFTYLSNAEREGMIKGLRELLAKLEADPTGRGILTSRSRRE